MGSRNKVVKDKGKSIRARLLNLSKESPYDYNIMLSRYVQERMLYRLSLSKYREQFILKGGALLYAHYQVKSRPTLDVDFLIKNLSNDKEHIKAVFKEILSIKCLDDALTFDVENITAEDIMEEKTYHGVRIKVKGVIDGMPQPLSIDVGFGDVTVPDPQELTYPIILGEMSEFCVNAYSLETVIAEKFHTMIILSIYNSRMKDFYDVYSILSSDNYDKEVLEDAIRATFINRHTPYSENHLLFTDEFFLDSTKTTQWNKYLEKIKYSGSLPFTEVGRLIQKLLKPYWDSLKLDK